MYLLENFLLRIFYGLDIVVEYKSKICSKMVSHSIRVIVAGRLNVPHFKGLIKLYREPPSSRGWRYFFFAPRPLETRLKNSSVLAAGQCSAMLSNAQQCPAMLLYSSKCSGICSSKLSNAQEYCNTQKILKGQEETTKAVPRAAVDYVRQLKIQLLIPN